jgi:hypothetical protein
LSFQNYMGIWSYYHELWSIALQCFCNISDMVAIDGMVMQRTSLQICCNEFVLVVIEVRCNKQWFMAIDDMIMQRTSLRGNIWNLQRIWVGGNRGHMQQTIVGGNSDMIMQHIKFVVIMHNATKINGCLLC